MVMRLHEVEVVERDKSSSIMSMIHVPTLLASLTVATRR